MGERNFSFDKKDRNGTNRLRSSEVQRLENAGFPARDRQKPGRLPGPHKVQLMSTVLPQYFDEIKTECERTGLTRGEIIQKIWDFYKKNHGDKEND